MSTEQVSNAKSDLLAHRAAVSKGVDEASTFDTAYVVMNSLATVVACYGLLDNSAAVVIGAMIIAMLLGPISGVGLSLVDGDNALLRKALVTLFGGLFIVLATAFCIGLIHSDIPVTDEMMARTAPNLLDLMVALGGGAAGAYAVASPRLSVAFVGVAIATALVPPLATSSMLVARGDWGLAGGAFLLAFTNIIAIQFAFSLVFLFTGFHQVSSGTSWRTRTIVRNSGTLIAMLILGVTLAANLNTDITKQHYKSAVRKVLQRDLAQVPGSYLDNIRVTETKNSILVRAIVRGPAYVTSADVLRMQNDLPRSSDGLAAELRIRFVHADVMSAKGPLFDADPTVDKGHYQM